MLKKHARNKTDEQLREIADADGFGFASYTPFLPKGEDTTLEDCITALDYLINIVGEEKAGIGTDWVQDQDIIFLIIFPLIKVKADQLLHHIKKCRVKGLETLGHLEISFLQWKGLVGTKRKYAGF